MASQLFPSSEPLIIAATILLAIFLALGASKRFEAIADPALDKQIPTGARWWTTPFNYRISGCLYACLGIFIFFVLIKYPLLIAAGLKWAGVKTGEEKQVPEFLKEPILVLALATTLMLAVLKSEVWPVGGLDRIVRQKLQSLASIPKTLEAAIRQIRESVFDYNSEQARKVESYLASRPAVSALSDLPAYLKTSPFRESLYRTTTMHMALAEGRELGNPTNLLYRSNSVSIDGLIDEFDKLLASVDQYFLLRAFGDSPQQSVPIADLTAQIKNSLGQITARQLNPFASSILQSSHSLSARRRRLRNLGFTVVQLNEPASVSRNLLDDYAVFSLSAIPICWFVIIVLWLLGTRIDNAASEVFIRWPLLVTTLIAAGLYPCVKITSESIGDEGFRIKPVSYLLCFILSAVLSAAALTAVDVLPALLTKADGSGPLTIFSEGARRVAPFGLVGGLVSTITLMLVQRNWYRWRRSGISKVAEGLLVGLSAAVATVLAFIIKEDVVFAHVSLAAFLLRREVIVSVALLFPVGVVVGMYFPSATRRHLQGLMSNSTLRIGTDVALVPNQIAV